MALSTSSAKPSQPEVAASRTIRAKIDVGGMILALCVVALSFLLYIQRPFSVISDIGYQAFSAREYVAHYTPLFDSIRLVDTHDIAHDAVAPLMAWTPSWVALFVLAFKAGLPAGAAGRYLALLLSIAGALGWVRVVSLLNLRGVWRIAGIILASLYCLRTASVTKTGAGDLLIYAVAPWLIAAAASLSVPFPSTSRGRMILRSVILCLALGAVYWLKYTGIFLSIALVTALVAAQFASLIRRRFVATLGLLVLYGASFAAPALVLKLYNYSRSGTDFIEASAQYSRPRTFERFVGFVREGAFHSAPILFSAAPGIGRAAGGGSPAREWLLRVPGFTLLFLFLYLMLRRPPSWERNATILCAVIPLVVFPLLSFATGPHFTIAIGRCTEPYWILLELMILKLLAEGPAAARGATRIAWRGLALTTAIQTAFLLWIPFSAIKESRSIAHSPTASYRTTATGLWNPDLSRYGTPEIVAAVKSLVRNSQDVVVPALYSNRAYGSDTMLEFAGLRLLPLNVFPLVNGHGVPGGEYYASAVFQSSAPLRIILVACDPYKRSDFQSSVEAIRKRFPQVREWKHGPSDPNGRVWIWVGEIG
jgi:hypothetical protein